MHMLPRPRCVCYAYTDVFAAYTLKLCLTCCTTCNVCKGVHASMHVCTLSGARGVMLCASLNYIGPLHDCQVHRH